MRYLVTLMIFLAGCTDTDRASISAYGRPGTITCFSGGKQIYQGSSTGRIQSVTQSDGWQFEEEGSGKFIRVSGDCLIKN